MSENKELNLEQENSSNAMPSMEDAMLAASEVNVGDLVTGEVLTIDDDGQVVVGLQGGQEGVIPRRELSASPIDNVEDIVSVGDQIEVVVVREVQDKEQGSYLLSKKRVDAQKVWEELAEKHANGETIEAPVTKVVKGGLVVDAGVRGFIPASLVDVNFIDDFTPYEGKTLELEITEIDAKDNRLILSHKAIQQKELQAEKAETLANLEAGQVVTGKVARLVKFGAFVDLGGVDGLIHISEIAHEHVDNPGDYLTVGDEVEVEVLSIDADDERISLSRKNIVDGPWDNIDEKIQKDDVIDGTVKRLVDFGAFVEIFPGVEGLLHISQIAHRHIQSPGEVLEAGQEIQVKVLDVNAEDERLSLSLKALSEPTPEEREEQEKRQQENTNRGGRDSNKGDQGRRNNSRRPQQRQQKQEEVETSFTFGDLLGDQLSDLFDN